MSLEDRIVRLELLLLMLVSHLDYGSSEIAELLKAIDQEFDERKGVDK